MFNDIAHFAFELKVVSLDLMKPNLLVAFELFVNRQYALDLSLFRCNDGLQDGYFIIIEAGKIVFPLLVSLSLFTELTIIE